MAGELMKIDKRTIAALDKAVEVGIMAADIQSQFEKAFTLAEAMKELRSALTPEVMKPIMALQNTSLGFHTDKKQGGYDEATVRDCLIEATLRGVSVCGNELNIIASRCYITKEGYGHLLRNVAGLSYVIIPGVPKTLNGGAIIDMEVRWKYNGKDEKQTLPICVRVNTGMGADAIIGKATRKARAWLYSYITGQEVGDGDVQEDTEIKVKAEVVSEPSKTEQIFHAEVADDKG